MKKSTEDEKEAIKISLNLQESKEEETVNRVRAIGEEEINKLFEEKREEIVDAATPKWTVIDEDEE